MIVFIYFGRNYIILSLNISHREKIKYKKYDEKKVLKRIINYCKKEMIYNLFIISNRLYYNINNIYDYEINIKWKIESKNIIKNKLEYYKINDILLHIQ